MEEKKETTMCNHCNGCGQHTGMSCCGGRHFVIRWVLAVIILATVLCVGIKIGEFRAVFGDEGFGGMMGGYGYHGRMMPYSYGNEYYGWAPQMMGGYVVSGSATVQPPSQTPKAVK